MKHCRKLLAVILTVLMVASCATLAFAADSGITWSFDEKTKILTIAGEGDMDNYEAEDNQAPWYDCGEKCEGIVFGDEVTSIGDYAFSEFSKLTTVTIPGNIKRIGQDAFYGCADVVLNDDDIVTEVKSSLTTVILKEGVEVIDGYAFDSSYVSTIVLPSTIKSIGNYAFVGSSELTVNYAGDEDAWNNIEIEGEAFTSFDENGDDFTITPTVNYNYVEPTPEEPSEPASEPATDPSENEGKEDEGNFFTRLWAKFIAFFRKIGDFFRNLIKR